MYFDGRPRMATPVVSIILHISDRRLRPQYNPVPLRTTSPFSLFWIFLTFFASQVHKYNPVPLRTTSPFSLFSLFLLKFAFWRRKRNKDCSPPPSPIGVSDLSTTPFLFGHPFHSFELSYLSLPHKFTEYIAALYSLNICINPAILDWRIWETKRIFVTKR